MILKFIRLFNQKQVRSLELDEHFELLRIIIFANYVTTKKLYQLSATRISWHGQIAPKSSWLIYLKALYYL